MVIAILYFSWLLRFCIFNVHSRSSRSNITELDVYTLLGFIRITATPQAHFGIVPRHAGILLYIFSYAHSTVPFLKVKCMIPSASTVTFPTMEFHSIGVNSTTFSLLSISYFAKNVSILRCQIDHLAVFTVEGSFENIFPYHYPTQNKFLLYHSISYLL